MYPVVKSCLSLSPFCRWAQETDKTITKRVEMSRKRDSKETTPFLSTSDTLGKGWGGGCVWQSNTMSLSSSCISKKRTEYWQNRDKKMYYRIVVQEGFKSSQNFSAVFPSLTFSINFTFWASLTALPEDDTLLQISLLQYQRRIWLSESCWKTESDTVALKGQSGYLCPRQRSPQS